MVHDAGTEGKLSVQCRVRDEHSAALDDTFQDGGVQLVQLLRWSLVEAEADRAQSDWSEKIQTGFAADSFCKVLRQVQVVHDRFTERTHSVIAK